MSLSKNKLVMLVILVICYDLTEFLSPLFKELETTIRYFDHIISVGNPVYVVAKMSKCYIDRKMSMDCLRSNNSLVNIMVHGSWYMMLIEGI